MDRPPGETRFAGDARATPSLRSRSRAVDDASVDALLDASADHRVRWATPDGFEAAGRGVAARLTAGGGDRFDRIETAVAGAFADLDHDGPRAARPRAFGGFSFHDGHRGDDPWRGFPAAAFAIPRVQAVRTDDGAWLTVVGDAGESLEDDLDRWCERLADDPARPDGRPGPGGSAPGVAETARLTSRREWTRGVETVLSRIADGDVRKVTLAQALSARLAGPIDVPAVVARLGRRYPNCYRFLIDAGEGATFFGAPPERLVSMRGDRVETEALAGSMPRGETPAEDDALADRMESSDKFRREHGLVVESIRDQLSDVDATVRVGDRELRRLATIQHLRTPIEAGGVDRHVLAVVAALHPTPAVGGLPPARAGETIRAAETFDRGWYAAPVGWIDADGNGEFAVAIRSGVAADGAVTMYAGNGIVADSDPDEEWDEAQLKYRPVLDELR